LSTERAAPPMNLLVAYPYVSPHLYRILRDFGAVSGVNWLLDSGAFTAWKSGQPVKLDDYCAFLRDLPVTPWRYFALDVVGDGDATLRNYETMLERGFKPVPVFTRGERLEVLERYYATSDLVAIGGLVSKVNPCRPYIKYLHQHLRGRRCHLLGFSSMDWLKYLKPYSCDSSSWESARRYGRVQVYMGHGRMVDLGRSDIRKHLGDGDVAARVRMLGFDLAELMRPAAWNGGESLSGQIATASWMWMAIDVEQRLGTKLFLALAAAKSQAMPFFVDAYARALRAAGYAPTQSARRTA